MLRLSSMYKGPVALGEMGLDWQNLYAPPQEQCKFFEMQLSLAQQHGKPAIIHARSGQSNACSTDGDAVASVLELIEAMNYTAGGIMHCFSGSYEQAKRCIDKGFYISCAANVSYASAHELQELVRRIPLEYLLVETDAPYLLHKKTHVMQRAYYKQALKLPSVSGEPAQKKRRYNHPSYLPFVYESVATLRAMSVETLVQALYANMQKLLRL